MEGMALERILDYLLPVGFLKYSCKDEYIWMLRVGSGKAKCELRALRFTVTVGEGR